MLFRFTAFSLGSYARENNAHEFWLSLETTANMNWVQLFHMDALSWLRTMPWDNGIWTCTKHLHYTMEKMALRFEEDIYTYVIYIYIMSMQSFWKLTLRLTVYERQAPGRNLPNKEAIINLHMYFIAYFEAGGFSFLEEKFFQKI